MSAPAASGRAAIAGAVARMQLRKSGDLARALRAPRSRRANPTALISSVLIKPVGDACNLRCTYCYERPEPLLHRRMSTDVLDALIADLPNYTGQRLTVAWHGGEPMLAGRDFLRESITRFADAGSSVGIEVAQAIQTNAVLVDRRWAELLLEMDMDVGVSLDGPADLHDMSRIGPNGRPTHRLVRRGIEQLVATGVRVGAIAVISESHANRADDVLNAIAETGICRFDAHPAVGKECSLGVSGASYSQFMCELFDAWLAHDHEELEIATFDDAIAWLLGGQPRLCYFAGACTQIVGVEPSGDVVPCTRPFDRSQWTFGNVLDQPLSEILTGSRYREFQRLDRQAQSHPRDCRWSGLCNQGCPQHRQTSGKDDVGGRNLLCSCTGGSTGFAELFGHIEQRLDDYVPWLYDCGMIAAPPHALPA